MARSALARRAETCSAPWCTPSSCGLSEGLQVALAARSLRQFAAFGEGLGALSYGMALSGKMIMVALRTCHEKNLQSRRLKTQEQLAHMKRLNLCKQM